MRKYGDVVALFKAAKAAHGRVDAAVGCAGVLERGTWFGEGMTPEGVEEAPDMGTVEVNLQGGLYFARVACGYLNGGGGDKALVLVSSAAGFRESPGLPVYQVRVFSGFYLLAFLSLLFCFLFGLPGFEIIAITVLSDPLLSNGYGLLNTCEHGTEKNRVKVSKDHALFRPANLYKFIISVYDTHASRTQTTKTGLLGLARNLSLTLHPTTGIRTNILLPAMTETGMVGPAAQLFRMAGLAVNSAEDVAAFMVDMIARKERNGKALNGLAVYVEGGRGWEIEEGLKRTMREWLGSEPVERIEEDKRVVEAGMWGK